MNGMKSVWIGFACMLAISACASSSSRSLNLFAGEPQPARIDSQFSGEVISHFGAKAEKAKVERKLASSGFQCADVPPVEARGDYLMARCTLPKPHGQCSDLWTVELRYAGGDSIAPHGTFRRDCVPPAAPNG